MNKDQEAEQAYLRAIFPGSHVDDDGSRIREKEREAERRERARGGLQNMNPYSGAQLTARTTVMLRRWADVAALMEGA